MDAMCTFFHVHGFIVALAVALLSTNASLPYLRGRDPDPDRSVA